MTDGDEKSSGGIWERELVTKLATAALKEQRRARLWGIFFKLLTFAYITLILLMAVDWRRDGVTGKKHTAMVEVNGLIAPGSDASAERITSALQLARRQPGAGADHLRRDEAPAQEIPRHPSLRGDRGRVRLGRLFRRRRRRPHLCRKSEHRRLDRGADERLRLYGTDGEARRRA